ncbi:MAG TPA: type II toxin-antitoxin system Phd/YefM family antitoxin [Caldilineae bacterium]|nr:type II toxin-antitoxin system Phd/YefM family antitoxin [Caldilineae bacterium]
MKASIVELRYNMKDVLKALNRNETVQVMYRGVLKGVIKPATKETSMRVEDHPFFGMLTDDEPVDEVMDKLRGNRYRAI